MLRLRLNQSGETLIEVALALTILGLVLGVSTAAVSRSLRISRDAQERTEASQHAQDMIETLRAYAQKNDPALNAIIYTPGQICMDASVAVIEMNTDSDPTNNDPPVPYNALAPDPMCKKGGSLYTAYLEITALGGTPQQYEYRAVVQWESIVSGQPSEAVMRYKWTRLN